MNIKHGIFHWKPALLAALSLACLGGGARAQEITMATWSGGGGAA